MLPQLTASPWGTEPQGFCSQPLQHHLHATIAQGCSNLCSHTLRTPRSMYPTTVPHPIPFMHSFQPTLAQTPGAAVLGSPFTYSTDTSMSHWAPSHATGAQTAPVPQPSCPHIPPHAQIPTHSFPVPQSLCHPPTHTPCASPTTPKSPAHTYKPTNPIHLVPSTLYPINPTIPTCPTVLQHPYAHTSPQAAQFSVSQPHMHPNSKISPAHTPPFLLRSPTAPQPYIPHKSKLP